MLDRLNEAKTKGCDAVDPDNVDGYSEGNSNGIGETQLDAGDYLLFLAKEAHNRDLAIGLKNAGELAQNKTIADALDFAVVEECFTNTDDSGNLVPNCSEWSLFYMNNKPVYSIEYPIRPVDNTTFDLYPWDHVDASARCSAWNAQPSHSFINRAPIGSVRTYI
jgi:endo-alpha-1,4-polygalactosaminidase (GH114 family)